jgi:hydroxymethylbilane synthase
MGNTIRIGTRRSQLALWQAEHVAELLRQKGLQAELVAIETKGDKILDRSLSKIGSKGVFTEELEAMLRSGEVHIAVHSAKDVPSALPDDLELIAFSERESAYDVLVSRNTTLSLQKPLRVGTSSTRRRALIRRYYPHWEVVEVRGNLQTRLRKMEEGLCDALLLAYAGVHRMGYDPFIVHRFDIEQFTPAVGQGSLAIEAHKELAPALRRAVIEAINHPPTADCLLAERAFLARLQGGCSVPVFGHAFYKDGQMKLLGGVMSLDGKQAIQDSIMVHEAPEAAGTQLAERLLQAGAGDILKEIKAQL